tara:strand:+ start:579 stop:995 length:417 start_codon:yes stop_codon:yes gene_type:complete
MPSTGPSYDDLKRWTLDFTDAFNRDDLDGVMAYFTDDAVYDQFDGSAATGREAIREAFAPQFSGAFGQMRFLQEDLFIDAEAGKTMISWTCTLATKRGPAGWRGLDLLHFDGQGRLTAKLTYAKTKSPLLADRGDASD